MISWRGPGASPIPTDKCATSRHWPGDCGLGSMICTKRGRRKQRRLILENISNKGRQTSTYNPHPSLDIVYLRLYQTPFWMFGLPGRVHLRTCTIGFRVLYFIVELRQIVRENPNGIKIGLFFKFRMNHILEFEYYDPIENKSWHNVVISFDVSVLIYSGTYIPPWLTIPFEVPFPQYYAMM